MSPSALRYFYTFGASVVGLSVALLPLSVYAKPTAFEQYPSFSPKADQGECINLIGMFQCNSDALYHLDFRDNYHGTYLIDNSDLYRYLFNSSPDEGSRVVNTPGSESTPSEGALHRYRSSPALDMKRFRGFELFSRSDSPCYCVTEQRASHYAKSDGGWMYRCMTSSGKVKVLVGHDDPLLVKSVRSSNGNPVPNQEFGGRYWKAGPTISKACKMGTNAFLSAGINPDSVYPSPVPPIGTLASMIATFNPEDYSPGTTNYPTSYLYPLGFHKGYKLLHERKEVCAPGGNTNCIEDALESAPGQRLLKNLPSEFVSKTSDLLSRGVFVTALFQDWTSKNGTRVATLTLCTPTEGVAGPRYTLSGYEPLYSELRDMLRLSYWWSTTSTCPKYTSDFVAQVDSWVDSSDAIK